MKAHGEAGIAAAGLTTGGRHHDQLAVGIEFKYLPRIGLAHTL
jgi:hypothetical protein